VGGVTPFQVLLAGQLPHTVRIRPSIVASRLGIAQEPVRRPSSSPYLTVLATMDKSPFPSRPR
jgi:hypothetical protein